MMLATAVLWLACTVIFWWLWGVGFEAAEASRPMPAVTKWTAPSFLVDLGSFITFWVAFVVSVFHRTRTAVPPD